jgi:hypothetical protein
MGILSEQQEAEKLREMERERDRPSALFLQTVGEIAAKLKLEPGPMIAGDGVRVGSVAFQVAHDSQEESDGLTLFVHMGAVPADDQANFLRRLLEHNLSQPVTTSGFYGLLHGTDTVVLRKRFDFAKTSDPAMDVLTYIAVFATQLDALGAAMKAGIELAMRLAQGEPAAADRAKPKDA